MRTNISLNYNSIFVEHEEEIEAPLSERSTKFN